MILSEDVLNRIRKNAQFGYNSIVYDFENFAVDDRAEFIVATLVESEQGLPNSRQMEQIFGISDYSPEFAPDLHNQFMVLEEHIEANVEVEDTFPGFEDYWFTVNFELDGSIAVRLMVGAPVIEYELKLITDEGDSALFFSLPTISYLNMMDITDNFYIEIPEDFAPMSVQLKGFDSKDDRVAYELWRDDEMPLTEKELDFLRAILNSN